MKTKEELEYARGNIQAQLDQLEREGASGDDYLYWCRTFQAEIDLLDWVLDDSSARKRATGAGPPHVNGYGPSLN